MGCTVEELGERISYAEFAQWCEYEAWEEQRIGKIDVYLARITAMLSAQLEPKKTHKVNDFLIGGDPGVSLRDMSSDDAKKFWRNAVPFAKYEEVHNG